VQHRPRGNRAVGADDRLRLDAEGSDFPAGKEHHV
jgi:hypothetical protein